MDNFETSGANPKTEPYKPLREHPKYSEIKKIIDEMPSEKLNQLKKYIEKWMRENGPN